MRLKFEIRDAEAAYVEQKVGAELYVHLRAVPAIVDFRRAAVERAYSLHAECDPTDECRRGALGLLVLQRAMLAVEDLGGLLHALDEPPSFERLLSYGLRDISAVFARLFANPELTPRLYGLASSPAIGDEPGRRSALAYGSRSTTAAEDNLNRLVHHQRGRYFGPSQGRPTHGRSDDRVDLQCLRETPQRPAKTSARVSLGLRQRKRVDRLGMRPLVRGDGVLVLKRKRDLVEAV